MSWSDVVRIPADVEQPDRIVWGLTARHVAILAVTGVALYFGYTMAGERLPLAVFAAIALPMAVLESCWPSPPTTAAASTGSSSPPSGITGRRSTWCRRPAWLHRRPPGSRPAAAPSRRRSDCRRVE